MRDYEFYYTQDGSIGLYSYEDHDVYHSKFGALTEAWEKFVMPSGIEKKLNTVDSIRVLDVCYGIGYNTKALISYVINTDEKLLKKEKNFKLKIKNIIKKYFPALTNIVSIDDNKINIKDKSLSNPNETRYSKVYVDCLEIDKTLVKISPLLKTIITPQEIYTKIVPKIFDCFSLYWKIKKFIGKCFKFLAPKNKKEIRELLDLRFNNDYDEIENEYRINSLTNYIIIDSLINHYKNNYFDDDLKKIVKDRKFRKYFAPYLIKYAKFKQDFRYNFISRFNLAAFLHNIYYDHLSKRYNKIKSKDIEGLFKLNFFINDARKSIFELNGEYDYIYLDAFTFTKAPQLWSVEFIAELYRHLSPTGLIMTYSNSALVRNTFIENNFYVGKICDKKTGKFIGTVASKEKSMIEFPLSNYELGLCSTKAGIPYHDETLSSTKEAILKRREIEFKTSDLMSSSKYLKYRRDKLLEGLDDEEQI